MFNKYLLTGATGLLGNTIAWMLHQRGIKCVAFALSGDPYISKLPPSIKVVHGDVQNIESLYAFFSEKDENTCLLHCAGIVSIATKKNPCLYSVNVDGTKNVLSLALEKGIKKTIYVSSIHAIPTAPKNNVMTEISTFDKDLVKGEYAKTKAIATNLALDYSKLGLNISIVHPSGIIGPGDWRCGEITHIIRSYLKGKLPAGSQGQNNFVDVRDVANGVLSCANHGKNGECYLLTGHQSPIKKILEQVRRMEGGKRLIYLPLWLIRMIALIYEKLMIRKKQKAFLTPYSAYALGANSNYSFEKANKELKFTSRPLEETIRDVVGWLKEVQLQ